VSNKYERIFARKYGRLSGIFVSRDISPNSYNRNAWRGFRFVSIYKWSFRISRVSLLVPSWLLFDFRVRACFAGHNPQNVIDRLFATSNRTGARRLDNIYKQICTITGKMYAKAFKYNITRLMYIRVSRIEKETADDYLLSLSLYACLYIHVQVLRTFFSFFNYSPSRSWYAFFVGRVK